MVFPVLFGAVEHGLGHEAHEGLELFGEAAAPCHEEGAKVAPGEQVHEGASLAGDAREAFLPAQREQSRGNQGDQKEAKQRPPAQAPRQPAPGQ